MCASLGGRLPLRHLLHSWRIQRNDGRCLRRLRLQKREQGAIFISDSCCADDCRTLFQAISRLLLQAAAGPRHDPAPVSSKPPATQCGKQTPCCDTHLLGELRLQAAVPLLQPPQRQVLVAQTRGLGLELSQLPRRLGSMCLHLRHPLRGFLHTSKCFMKPCTACVVRGRHLYLSIRSQAGGSEGSCTTPAVIV